MKTKLGAIFLIAVLAVGAGVAIHFTNIARAEVVACGASVNGIAVGQCYLGSLCVNTGQASGTGVFVTSAQCGAISNSGSGGVSPNSTVSTRPILNWTPSVGATYYVVEISDRADFSNVILSKQVTTNSYVVGN